MTKEERERRNKKLKAQMYYRKADKMKLLTFFLITWRDKYRQPTQDEMAVYLGKSKGYVNRIVNEMITEGKLLKYDNVLIVKGTQVRIFYNDGTPV